MNTASVVSRYSFEPRTSPIGAGILERQTRSLAARRRVERLAAQIAFRFGRAHDRRRKAAERNPRVAHDVALELHDERDVDHRDRLRAAQAEFQKEPALAAAQRGKANRGDQFVGA